MTSLGTKDALKWRSSGILLNELRKFFAAHSMLTYKGEHRAHSQMGLDTSSPVGGTSLISRPVSAMVSSIPCPRAFGKAMLPL